MSESTTIAQYLEERWRNDDKPLAWHVQGIEEMWQALRDSALDSLVPDVHVAVGPPATALDIAAYQSLVPEPLPGELVEAWISVGGAGFTTPEHVYRWLSPVEIVERRAELRARVRKSMRKTRPQIDVLATLDDQPLIMFDPTQDAKADRWYHKADGEPYKIIRYYFSLLISLELMRELTSRVGDLFLVEPGRKLSLSVQRVRLEKDNKYWEAILDEKRIFTRSAKIGGAGKPTIKTLATPDAAEKQFTKLVTAAKEKGFVD